METKNSTTHNDLFSSLISDIKSYSGNDPLLPWLRGIKKMKECLPPNALKQKLPRFLQKCTQSFESDRRYRNDSRYLRVWLQLMDYVSDPRVLLSTMEKNSIGTKRSLFYQAYALYHEKMKNFEEAENMYRLGVQNLAEPVDELQKSYEQFLHRMERHKKKNIQHQIRRSGKRPRSSTSEDNNENVNSMDDRPKQILDGRSRNVKPMKESNHVGVSGNSCEVGLDRDLSRKKEHVKKIGHRDVSKQQKNTGESDEPEMCHGDDTVVVKFVDTAIVGKQEAEDACHHGLVDPTINMKEAMNAINGMFREPLETFPVSRSRRSRPKEECNLNNGFDVFIDENLDSGTDSSLQKGEAGISLMVHGRSQIPQTHQEPFQIFIDDEESDDNGDRAYDDKSEESKAQNLAEGSWSSVLPLNAFVFPSPKDLPSESSDYMNSDTSPRLKLREDTVVHRFVGSTILEEPAVENVCHHGLVDPTINLKEAMDDINNMFGKPIDFIRTKRPKKQEKAPVRKQDLCGFTILPDDDSEHLQGQPPTRSSRASNCDLFEPTTFTKEAMDDINKMFGKPLDF
ncbi:MITOTIC CHECKPOINT SERINE/THREONINE-PROTEIN KINASE BUB1 [Salix purpurea]|uniref:MITOTIC CHECKPOINT SERINE/THREONINE-PROTEIN KINASE BUB1 n=2 Tax=Salix purpurea TaxID=77065 RepID=A0A9Q0TUN0_SALPP|nr:MITOTIC CHECKPOINT SERINE/THREONINE-PROTEIN KINASE BUB1 [Salix purpurea]